MFTYPTAYLDFCKACCSSNDSSSCLVGVTEFAVLVSFLTFAQMGGFWKRHVTIQESEIISTIMIKTIYMAPMLSDIQWFTSHYYDIISNDKA